MDRRPWADARSGASPSLDEAFGGEEPECVPDGGFGYAICRAEGGQRRQLVAWRELTRGDALPQFSSDAQVLGLCHCRTTVPSNRVNLCTHTLPRPLTSANSVDNLCTERHYPYSGSHRLRGTAMPESGRT
ncbi:hypothetical protein SGPA1_30799 [Streptomyces misionensis JCM 4497]